MFIFIITSRFLHMDELREWKAYRDKLRFWTHMALGLLVCLTLVSFLGDHMDTLRRKLLSHKWRRRRPNSTSSESSGCGSPSICSSPAQTSDMIETVWRCATGVLASLLAPDCLFGILAVMLLLNYTVIVMHYTGQWVIDVLNKQWMIGLHEFWMVKECYVFPWLLNHGWLFFYVSYKNG